MVHFEKNLSELFQMAIQFGPNEMFLACHFSKKKIMLGQSKPLFPVQPLNKKKNPTPPQLLTQHWLYWCHCPPYNFKPSGLGHTPGMWVTQVQFSSLSPRSGEVLELQSWTLQESSLSNGIFCYGSQPLLLNLFPLVYFIVTGVGTLVSLILGVCPNHQAILSFSLFPWPNDCLFSPRMTVLPL